MRSRTIEQIKWYQGFGERIQLARKLRNISEEEAAAAFYVTAKTYRKWERGGVHRAGNHAALLNFHQTFDVPLDWLLGGPEYGPPPRFKLRLVS